MRHNSKQKVLGPNQPFGCPSRVTRQTGVLEAILFLALLYHPVPARGATLPGSSSVTLAWERSSSSGLAGYRVYFGATSGIYTSSAEAGNTTTNTVPGLVSGVTYFFAVKAYGTNGLESGFSNEVSFVPGLPSLQIRITASGQSVLTVKGPVGHVYDILATPDFKVWARIGYATMGAGGSLDFTDTNAPSFPKRFYRIRDTQP